VDESQAVKWFGTAGKKYYRLFFVVMAVLTTAAYLALVLVLPDRTIYHIPFPWVIFTGILQIAALLAATASIFFSRPIAFLGLDIFFDHSLGEPDERLNTGGLYHFVRHPTYSLSIVLIWLMPVMTWNLLALFAGVTLYTLIGSIFEERKLVVQFGAAYREYQKVTPAFIPHFKTKR
jgi:protein-S-isoprenylcysteine O-methyltransferase Ste14